MYAKCSLLYHTHQGFNQMPVRNIISYYSLVSAYAHRYDLSSCAFQLLADMRYDCFQPNGSTFTTLLQAASCSEDWFAGLALHCQIVKFGLLFDACVQIVLIGFYLDFEDLCSANHLFESIIVKDGVSQNCFISGNLKNNMTTEDPKSHLSDQDLEALNALHSSFQQCVSANGLGLKAVFDEDLCQVTMKFPDETVSKWSDPKTGEHEGLSHEFDLCEAVATWEQVRNSTTVLTKEYIDSLPNGWEDYAWKRINKGIQLKNCQNKSLCMEKLSLVLPQTPPYYPRQFHRCAVVGNSADLLKTKFGNEIDSYDAIFRQNGAPIQNYSEYVGSRSTFRLLNRGSAKALDKVAELYGDGKEALIIKTTIHDIMSKMIREIPIRNPVYLMLGTSFGSSAKGTGLKALEFSLSICDTVDIYGFTVDPGYEEWTRYFSESRGGHTPLHGRAYYQMMECLGLIKIHSPMRADPHRDVKWLPSHETITAARIASEKILARVGAGSHDPLGACSIVKKQKVNQKPPIGLRKDAVEHQKYVKGTSMYPLEHHPGHGLLCTAPNN